MTTTDHPTGASAWLASSAMRTASDALLGCILLVAGAVAIWDSRGASFGDWERLDAGFFPIFVGALAAAVGVLLLGRAAFFSRPQPVPWSLWGVGLVVAGVAVVEAGVWRQPNWLLFFGPPEYAALLVLAFVAAIALARWSLLRAVGMTLLGLLLGAVGIDIITGTLRMTMGFEQLMDGVSAIFVALGLIVVADGLICLVSPSLWLATFSWVWVPQREPRLPAVTAIVLRAVAALAIAAACYLGFAWSAQVWDIGLILLFGLLGVACKLFHWNRPVLIVACIYGNVLEQSIRQTVMVSQGDLAIFFQRPISGVLLAVSIGLAALAVLLAARRRPRTPPFPAAR